MTTKFRVSIAGVTLAALAALIAVGSSTRAGDDSKPMRDAVHKVAKLLKAGKKDEAKKVAADEAKKIADFADLMHMFRPRNKGGMGVGSTAGTNPAKDGIEVKLRDLGRDVPAGIAKEAASLEETGYYVAALGELSAAKGWGRETGKRTKKAWGQFSDDMTVAGMAFAKAAASKGAQEIKGAAAKVNNTCSACHNTFKD